MCVEGPQSGEKVVVLEAWDWVCVEGYAMGKPVWGGTVATCVLSNRIELGVHAIVLDGTDLRVGGAGLQGDESGLTSRGK